MFLMGVDPLQESYTKKSHFNRMTFFYENFFVYYTVYKTLAMDILNFISWIKGGRVVTSVDPVQTLIPVGVKDNRRDDGYLTCAITVEDLAGQLGGNKLVDNTREVVLTDNGGTAELTFNPGTAIIQTSGSGSDLYIKTLTGDDIRIESGDDIVLVGDKGTYDQDVEGGDINIFAGDGSDGDINDAGTGGDIRIEAGAAGVSNSGNQAYGGFVTIQAGYTTETGLPGGDVTINAGNSVSNISGNIIVQGNFTWVFDTSSAIFTFPAVPLASLPNPVAVSGAKAMISDCTLAALNNFGKLAGAGGVNIVPVFSDGSNWLIG